MSTAIKNLIAVLKNVPQQNKDYQKWFLQIASILMNHFVISYDHKKARLTELEFYFHDNPSLDENNTQSIHPDDTSHRNELQKGFATWYFHHTAPNKNSGYKNLDYTGLDLCFGSEQFTFGILIRAIEILPTNQTDKAYIYGPSSLLLKEIFPRLDLIPERQGKRKIINRPEFLELMEKIETGNIFEHPIIQLNPFDFEIQEKVYFAPRIGLNPQKTYARRPYRYLIYLDKKHLNKNVIQDFIVHYKQ